MSRVRTFIAIDVAEEIGYAGARVLKKLACAGGKVRPVEPENMHLTVKFVGDFEETKLAELCFAAQRAASAVKPFELRFAGIGAFPRPDSPRVIYLGCTDEPRGSIAQLHRLLDDELYEIGVPREGKRFTPHLTLARVKVPDKTGELARSIALFKDLDAGPSPVEEVSIYLSELTSGGPVYTPAGRAKLGDALGTPNGL